eukprot:scaffold21193_cov62-Phaeocystis_antarctica.AAC.1
MERSAGEGPARGAIQGAQRRNPTRFQRQGKRVRVVRVGWQARGLCDQDREGRDHACGLGWGGAGRECSTAATCSTAGRECAARLAWRVPRG